MKNLFIFLVLSLAFFPSCEPETITTDFTLEGNYVPVNAETKNLEITFQKIIFENPMPHEFNEQRETFWFTSFNGSTYYIQDKPYFTVRSFDATTGILFFFDHLKQTETIYQHQ